jgi:hypothetical protein
MEIFIFIVLCIVIALISTIIDECFEKNTNSDSFHLKTYRVVFRGGDVKYYGRAFERIVFLGFLPIKREYKFSQLGFFNLADDTFKYFESEHEVQKKFYYSVLTMVEQREKELNKQIIEDKKVN